jgi:hypothetical protein
MPSAVKRMPVSKGQFAFRPIRPEEAAELRELYEELPYAAMRAAEALHSDGATLRGDDLLPFWRADNAVTEIIQRINEILEAPTKAGSAMSGAPWFENKVG